MLKHIPNLLTGLRLVLAFVFFAMLSRYQYERLGALTFLNIAFIVYAVALITDFFDGYLARKWKAEGAFGRITDPFVDKVLVLGSFIFFAAKNFVIPFSNPEDIPSNVMTITGVTPWMVVILLARELLVTTFRGAGGKDGQFGAQFSGKVKMTLQSATILVILAFVNFHGRLEEMGYEPMARLFRNVCIWATVLVTVYSGLLYIGKIVAVYRSEPSNDI
jgi:CDP-diacylglycerol---glycerol-3-phosphate 3-phosphatidyltransferase